MNPREAEKLQNEIYRKMPPAKKLRIASQFFLLGGKLNALKNEKNRNAGGASLRNCKDPRRA